MKLKDRVIQFIFIPIIIVNLTEQLSFDPLDWKITYSKLQQYFQLQQFNHERRRFLLDHSHPEDNDGRYTF